MLARRACSGHGEQNNLLLLLSAVLPVKAAAETAPAKVVRVGSFEDTFNYVNEKGARKGGST